MKKNMESTIKPFFEERTLKHLVKSAKDVKSEANKTTLEQE